MNASQVAGQNPAIANTEQSGWKQAGKAALVIAATTAVVAAVALALFAVMTPPVAAAVVVCTLLAAVVVIAIAATSDAPTHRVVVVNDIATYEPLPPIVFYRPRTWFVFGYNPFGNYGRNQHYIYDRPNRGVTLTVPVEAYRSTHFPRLPVVVHGRSGLGRAANDALSTRNAPAHPGVAHVPPTVSVRGSVVASHPVGRPIERAVNDVLSTRSAPARPIVAAAPGLTSTPASAVRLSQAAQHQAKRVAALEQVSSTPAPAPLIRQSTSEFRSPTRNSIPATSPLLPSATSLESVVYRPPSAPSFGSPYKPQQTTQHRVDHSAATAFSSVAPSRSIGGGAATSSLRSMPRRGG